jgi:aspartyl-tRNA(Asn)/glutamyl-tRNA(Gln) amidotransferase subunit C
MNDEMKHSHNIDIERLAMLARIHLSDEEKHRVSEDLESILEYFDKISQVNIAGVEPSAHGFPLFNVIREDKAGAAFDPETALQNAPKQRNNQIIVPKILE